MKKQWRKLGQLYAPKENRCHPKLASHAANPLAVHMEGDIYRIFFSGRDRMNRSSVGAVDIDILRRQIVTEHTKPFFEHGSLNSFYSAGVSIGNCYDVAGVKYMLFMGWQNPPNQHWRGDIGRLIVSPELFLTLDQQEPLMGNDSIDPISLSYPWVLPREEGGFNMWYGSTLAWDAGNGEMLHVIRHAYSTDGDTWLRTGLDVPYELNRIQAFSRPTVIQSHKGEFEMWFSYRGGLNTKYRIGYARSVDGKKWTLDLRNSGIDVSAEGWDSEMIEYPFVFEHKSHRYMLYNGNGYGKTGFGLAVLEETI